MSREVGVVKLSCGVALGCVVLRRAKQTAATTRAVLSDDDVDVEDVGRASHRRLALEAAAKQRSGKKYRAVIFCSQTIFLYPPSTTISSHLKKGIQPVLPMITE